MLRIAAFFLSMLCSFGLIGQGVDNASIKTQAPPSNYSDHFYNKGQTDMKQQTLSIIKPDAIKKNIIGPIISRLEEGGLRVVAAKMVHLSKERAEQFYAVHKDRPFFQELVSFMTESPVLVMVLQGDEAVAQNRKLMGATNPKEAEKGTIRADFATDIERNSVHGSDSIENAEIEINFFFSQDEIFHS